MENETTIWHYLGPFSIVFSALLIICILLVIALKLYTYWPKAGCISFEMNGDTYRKMLDGDKEPSNLFQRILYWIKGLYFIGFFNEMLELKNWEERTLLINEDKEVMGVQPKVIHPITQIPTRFQLAHEVRVVSKNFINARWILVYYFEIPTAYEEAKTAISFIRYTPDYPEKPLFKFASIIENFSKDKDLGTLKGIDCTATGPGSYKQVILDAKNDIKSLTGWNLVGVDIFFKEDPAPAVKEAAVELGVLEVKSKTSIAKLEYDKQIADQTFILLDSQQKVATKKLGINLTEQIPELVLHEVLGDNAYIAHVEARAVEKTNLTTYVRGNSSISSTIPLKTDEV
jgi:hypothetical protein